MLVAIRRRTIRAFVSSSRTCSYISDRKHIWESLFQKRVQEQESVSFPPEIVIQLPNQTSITRSSSISIRDIIRSTSDLETDLSHILAAEVNGEILDLSTKVSKDIIISRFITFDSLIGKRIFWHSTAHLLGYALEQFHAHPDYISELWNKEEIPKRRDSCKILLDDGPAKDSGGYFYDFLKSEQFTENLCEKEQPFLKGTRKWMNYLMKQGEEFERLELSKSEALELFSYNPLKQKIIERLRDDEKISSYKVGEFVDLCKGPHVPSLSHLKWFDLQSVALQTNNENQEFYRVEGIAFPRPEMRKEWEKKQQEAKQNDHRIIGKNQQLFMTHPWSAGSPFFLPHGVTIYSRLQRYLANQYKTRGYQEVISPNIFLKDLWETSGHWQNYKENMFTVTSNHKINEKADSVDPSNATEHFCLKPMNCPAHCLIFDHQTRSYKDLPIRLAEFGVLHRDELAGTLTGLTRVRRFLQDDAHIFCMEDQIATEVTNCLEFVKSVYSMFNFEFSLCLSTRPEKAMGDIEQWNRAEEALKNELSKSGLQWRIKEGDGAFYGPKIDITITDVHEREHQCATIQLDFQLPQRFNLHYVGSDGKKHMPVMIHRAILGSFERFIAILIEHTRGRWPLWLSPRQCLVCTANAESNEYAQDVAAELRKNDILAEVNISADKLAKKIKEGTNFHFNYILVLGANEHSSGTISYRQRGSAEMTNCTLQDFCKMLHQKMDNFE